MDNRGLKSVILLGLCSFIYLLQGCSTEIRQTGTRNELSRPYRSAVWVEASDGNDTYKASGVIIHSSKRYGTYILTAYHLVDTAQEKIQVGIFKSSRVRPIETENDYKRYGAAIICGGFQFPLRIAESMRMLGNAHSQLLDMVEKKSQFPITQEMMNDFNTASRAFSDYRGEAALIKGLDEFRACSLKFSSDVLQEELTQIGQLAKEAGKTDELKSIKKKMSGSFQQITRELSGEVISKMLSRDLCILKLDSEELFISIHFSPLSVKPSVGEEGVRIHVEREGSPVVVSGKFGSEGNLASSSQSGHSGAGEFYKGRLSGIHTRKGGTSVEVRHIIDLLESNQLEYLISYGELNIMN